MNDNTNRIDEKLANIDLQQAKKAKFIIRLLTAIFIISVIIFLIYGYSNHWFDSEEPLADFFASLGIPGYILGAALIILNTIFPIIPGALPSVAVYMAYEGLVGYLSVLVFSIIGSMISFTLSKRYGKTFVLAFVPEDMYQNLIAKIQNEKTAVKIAVIAFLVPGLPDDATVMVCGLTNMKPWTMFIVLLLTKPLPTLLYLWGFSKIVEFLFGWITRL